MDNRWDAVDSILAQLTEVLTKLEQTCVKSPEDVERLALCKNLVDQLRSETNPIAKEIIIEGDIDNENNGKGNIIDDLELETIRSMSGKRSQLKSIDMSSLPKTPIIVRINATHNFYYSIFGESNTKWIFQNMINSKCYAATCMSLVTGFGVLGTVFVDQYQWFVASSIILLSFTFSYLLSLNYDIMRLVFGTFDFWYKISITILPMAYMVLTCRSLFTKVFSTMSSFFLNYLIFMIDSAFWSYKLKFYMLASCV